MRKSRHTATAIIKRSLDEHSTGWAQPLIEEITSLILRAREAEIWREAAEIARTYFEPCDLPADISARECGEQIAAALRARGEAA